MNKTITFIILLAVFALSTRGIGEAQYSKDAWTHYLEVKGLFTPHIDDCSGSEEFVTTGPGTLGVCIEASERGADELEDARKTCIDLGMRLPEPLEFKYACNNTGGLSNMTDDWEWGSNYVSLMHDNSYNYTGGTAVGNGGCGQSAPYYAMANNISPSSLPFRCVR